MQCELTRFTDFFHFLIKRIALPDSKIRFRHSNSIGTRYLRFPKSNSDRQQVHLKQVKVTFTCFLTTCYTVVSCQCGWVMRTNAMIGIVLLLGMGYAQEPGRLPSTLPTPMPDEGIVPAQYVRPAAGTSSTTINGSPNLILVPVVSLDVIVPQNSAANAVIPCKIVVKNNSNADAYSVKIRVPFNRLGASTLDNPKPTMAVPLSPQSRNAIWNYPTLRAGESKTITFDLKPDATIVNNGELALKAFVNFEHGVEVLTKLGTPKLQIDKSAPKDAATGESIPVSIQIRNNGTVPLHDLKITESISAGFSFADGTTGEEVTANPLQRTWKMSTIQAGETKTVGYRVTAKQAGELLAMTSLDCKESVQLTKDSRTKVMTAGLSVKLSGTREVSPGEAATYTIKVRNTGDLAMKNVRVAGSVPDGCRATKMTNGGRMGRDQIEWVLPELKPGTDYDVRFALVGDTAGKRTISAVAYDSRGRDYATSHETMFAASADLHWETFAEPGTIAVGRAGTFTVRVKNTGGDAARNVVVKMELPAEVRKTTTKPKDVKEGGREIVFKSETIPPGATRDYVVEFKAEQAGRAYFNIKLEADTLGDKPMVADKMIVVTQARQ